MFFFKTNMCIYIITYNVLLVLVQKHLTVFVRLTSREYTDDIPNFLRMEADLDLMRRAITKEFKSGGGAVRVW
jgi:hypothetical protein